MHFRRSVQAETDGKPLVRQEIGPRGVEQQAVRLQAVCDPPAPRTVLPLEANNFPKELDAEERRLSAVPFEVGDGTG
jgi:hypothetical protein